MSSFIGIYTDNLVCIGTDTLVRRPNSPSDQEQVPMLFASKVYPLPQFKSAFGVTGIQQVGIAFYLFLNEHCIGKNVNSIRDLPVELFLDYLIERFGKGAWGTIYLYGLDGDSNTFRGYEMPVNRDNEPMVWNPLRSGQEDAWCVVPSIDNPDWYQAQEAAEAISNESNSGVGTFIVELMKIQKRNDEQKPLLEQVGIGGEVILTYMESSPDGFRVTSNIAHRFDDYDKQFIQMMSHSGTRPNQ